MKETKSQHCNYKYHIIREPQGMKTDFQKIIIYLKLVDINSPCKSIIQFNVPIAFGRVNVDD